jgi:hypothetical protein
LTHRTSKAPILVITNTNTHAHATRTRTHTHIHTHMPMPVHRFKFRRLDSSMDIAACHYAIHDFSTLPEVTVMLMSLKAAPLSVNLMSASNVVLLDLW